MSLPNAESASWPESGLSPGSPVSSPRSEGTPAPHWFSAEVQPHEASLRAYLRDAFPAVRDVDDVVQESYLRVWRARATQPIRSARAFLFRIARNLALDRVRHDRASPFTAVRDSEALAVLDHDSDPARVIDDHTKLLVLADAIESLPPRCRDVVTLRKLQHLSQRETAARLGLAEKTVEAHLARGLARCEDYLRRRGVCGWYDHD